MKAMTAERVRALIAEGYGQGCGRRYRPLLQIKRWNPSPVSCQVVAPLIVGRIGHFMARLEWWVALMLWWAGVGDAREQYPAWPFPHPHPLYQLDDVPRETLRSSRGLMAIARDAGIEHGRFPGTCLPYVASIDLMVTVRNGNGVPSLVAVAVKPSSIEQQADPLNRALERLELQRRYCTELGIRFVVVHEGLVPSTLVRQLDWLHSAALGAANVFYSSPAAMFLEALDRAIESEPIRGAIELAAERVAIPLPHADRLFQIACWQQAIDIDLTQPLIFSRMAVSGGRRLKDKILRALAEPALDSR